ncbi:MAG: SDR family NAD(P)-dependent oxidoreductase [Xanthobacteraceae bacterium]|nr:SDR family NAD(P)-dependent oxidoreductase [Xanthobacteraceae bacterium]
MTRLRSLTHRNVLIAIHDVLATCVAVVASLFLRFDGQTFMVRLPKLLHLLPYVALASLGVCYLLHLTTTKWRFISLPDLFNILKASTVLSFILLIADYLLVGANAFGPLFFGKTTIVIFWILEVFLLSAARIAYRYFRYSRTIARSRFSAASPTLLVGRAADAEVVLRSVESGAVKLLRPVGILSPSRADRGQTIRGIPVLGSIDDLSDVAADLAQRQRPITRVVMMPSALDADAHPESVLIRARKLGFTVSRFPSLEDGGSMALAPVEVEELLLRSSVKIDYQRLRDLIRGKSIIVTGGGGSIGSEICERILAFGAARLLVIDNSEPALHAVTERLTGKVEGTVVEARIADVRDRERIFSIFKGFQPDMVFHAAALKHVPILERDWNESIKTNIFGSVNVADAAAASSVAAMVMISTDKAIAPASFLGLTKRFAEMYCQALDADLARDIPDRPQLRLISVRFGNVLASSGSVVPKFKAQIEAGGPVTVTHPDMMRYFMTIREACDLVVTAASHAVTTVDTDVSVYILNMGQPVKIVDLAERMISLSGLRVGHDIDIVFTGVRPGEKLSETLFAHDEPALDIGIEGVVAARPNKSSIGKLQDWMSALHDALHSNRRDEAIKILKEAIPEFRVT